MAKSLLSETLQYGQSGAKLINTAAHTNPYTSTVHMLEYNSVVIIIQRNRIFVKRVFLEQEKFQKVVG